MQLWKNGIMNVLMTFQEEASLNSAPTVVGGMYRSTSFDEPSLGSAPTLVAGGSAGNSLGRIDQYELVRKLGGGGFGVVYLAKDTVSGIEVALKTLHPLLKRNAEEMDLLREKFALVARLSHPNIASPLVLHPVRDIMLSDESVRQELRLSPGDSIMVMRYAPGVTLSKWRRQFPGGIVPLEQVIEVGRQIASALDYAHSERIVHRDIKPSNVMVETLSEESPPSRVESSKLKVESSGGASSPSEPNLVTRHSSLVTSRIRVRILDFGLAAEIRSSMSRVSSEQGDTSGTRPYMAPEQWLGRKQDGRTDQYALACVLYELLSGAPPFAGVFETGDPVIMRTAVERDTPEEIDGIPNSVKTALLKALEKRPQDRFASCGKFVKTMEGEVGKGGASSPSEPQRNRASETLNQERLDTPDNSDIPARPEVSPHHDEASHEAGILRRKLSLAKALKAISEADRADKEFSKFIGTAEDEIAVAEEAIRIDKFAVADESLNRVESALEELRKAHLTAATEVENKKSTEAELFFQKGEDFRYGRKGMGQDYAEALRCYRKAAEKGHAPAQNAIGIMYYYGYGVEKNYAKAANWYRKAAEQGYALGQSNLGCMYWIGLGVVQSDAEAVKWFRMAAEHGLAVGQFCLGGMYEDGRGVAQDDKEAVNWYRKAAEQGHVFGQNWLGIMYEDGRGVAQDDKEAVNWYRKAAEQGYAPGQINLGLMYANGRGVVQDDKEAVSWYRKAAEQGDADGQNWLGWMYANGRGVVRNDKEAVSWYRKSAEQGYAAGQRNLGFMYANGRGVVQDDKEAVSWYRKAAEQGEANGQYLLGWMYQNGRGVAQDDTEALKWFRKAAEQGYADARNALHSFGTHE